MDDELNMYISELNDIDELNEIIYVAQSRLELIAEYENELAKSIFEEE